VSVNVAVSAVGANNTLTNAVEANIANGSGSCILASAPAAPEVYPVNTVVCKLGDMQPGQVSEVYLRTKVKSSVPKGDILHNVATVSTTSIDLDPNNNTATWDSNVDTKADLMITKEGVPFKADAFTALGPRVGRQGLFGQSLLVSTR
jgi:hypothetical protein